MGKVRAGQPGRSPSAASACQHDNPHGRRRVRMRPNSGMERGRDEGRKLYEWLTHARNVEVTHLAIGGQVWSDDKTGAEQYCPCAPKIRADLEIGEIASLRSQKSYCRKSPNFELLLLRHSDSRGMATVQRWGAILFWGAVIAGVAYFLFAGEKKNAPALPPAVAGWEEINECAPFASFDGSQTLDFEQSRKVSLTTESTMPKKI